jgi:hypothetical protein
LGRASFKAIQIIIVLNKLGDQGQSRFDFAFGKSKRIPGFLSCQSADDMQALTCLRQNQSPYYGFATTSGLSSDHDNKVRIVSIF